jgi:hypothetical protein
MSLKSLDNKLKEIAKSLNGELTKDNSKGMLMPYGFEERTVRWFRNDFDYIIQIYPEIKNDRINKWIFWACCSYDTDEGRYWKKMNIIEHRKQIKIIAEFDNLFAKAIDFLDNLKKEDLEFAVKLIR